MSGLSLVYTLFPDATSAQDIARTVIDERLAACVNVMAPCTSVYEWDGKREENAETPALFKTSSDKANALIARVAELHSYDVPAILSWRADDVHAPFAEWVMKQTQK